jgi:hypothetical protein
MGGGNDASLQSFMQNRDEFDETRMVQKDRCVTEGADRGETIVASIMAAIVIDIEPIPHKSVHSRKYAFFAMRIGDSVQPLLRRCRQHSQPEQVRSFDDDFRAAKITTFAFCSIN